MAPSKKRSPANHLSRGCRIILNKGKGPKRKYNGREVEVLEYPSRGGWMTVVLSGRAIKWRKGRYSVCPLSKAEKQRLERQKQQMLRISDNIWTTIFSFLVVPSLDLVSYTRDGYERKFSSEHYYVHKMGRSGRFSKHQHVANGCKKGPQTDLIWVKDAVQMHSLLSTVCRRWRSVCENNMATIFGKINANLDALPVRQVVPCIHWMIKHKVSIRSLSFLADYGDILFLIKLLNTCDTSRLTFVRARCNTVHFRPIRGPFFYRSRWISEAYLHQNDGGIIDLTDTSNSVTFAEKCKALGAPYSSSIPKLRQLHDAIAFNCKNLSELQVNLDIPEEALRTDFQDHLSKTLFSSHRICKLDLNLSLESGLSPVLEVILGNLVNLEELSIRSPSHRKRRIHLASTNLRSLDVSDLPKRNWISGDLPNLKTLMYDGFCSGIAPQFAGDPKVERENDGKYHFRADQCMIHNLNIPSACEIITKYKPGDPDSFIGNSDMVEEFRNSILC